MVRHANLREHQQALTGLYIRPAIVEDAEQIDRIQSEAFRTPWSNELIRGAVTNPRYQVQTLSDGLGRVLGFYIAHGDRESSNLDNLAVDTPERNRGHGTRLLLHWIGQIVPGDMSKLTLQVNTDNLQAQQLYEKYHFQAVKLLISYYPNGDDAYQMERLFTPPTSGFPL